MIERKMARAVTLAVAVVTLTLQLSACVPVIVAGVGAGAYAATDRRSVGAQVDDKAIAVRVDKRINEAISNRAHVNVNSFNRKVLLTGEVPDQATKDRAEQIAKSTENVSSVVSDLEVGGMTPSSARNNDAYLTAKVKTQLVSRKDIFANAYNVVTEKSIVYLMGRVTREEGDRAADIAREVSGVQKVVKVFDYISPEELTNLQKNGAQ